VQRQTTLQTRKRYPKRAFSRVRAGGSLNPGVYTKDGGASAIVGASLSDTSLGKRFKEPRLCFFFTHKFQKQDSGFYLFTGCEIRGLLCKK
jgi:hypothetical protein